MIDRLRFWLALPLVALALAAILVGELAMWLADRIVGANNQWRPPLW